MLIPAYFRGREEAKGARIKYSLFFAAVVLPLCVSATPSPLPPASEASLRYPLLVERDYDYFLLCTFQRALNQLGFKEKIPSAISINSAAQIDKLFDRYRTMVDSLVQATGDGEDPEFFDFGTVPQYLEPPIPLCYRGNGRRVAELIRSLIGHAFTDEERVIAWKFETEKRLLDLPDTVTESKFPPAWRRDHGTGVLMITSNAEFEDSLTNFVVEKCP